VISVLLSSQQLGWSKPLPSKNTNYRRQANDTRVWHQAISENRIISSDINSSFDPGEIKSWKFKQIRSQYLSLRKIIAASDRGDTTVLKAQAVDMQDEIRSLSATFANWAVLETKKNSLNAQFFAQEAYFGFYSLNDSDPHLETIYKIWYCNWHLNAAQNKEKEDEIKRKAARYK
jgi:hypothetical protein